MRNVMIGLITAGLIALAAGLLAGFGTVETKANGRTISCGSAWSPNYAAADREASVDRLASAMSGGLLSGDEGRRASCAAAYGSRSGLGIMLAIIGVGLAAAGAVIYGQQRSTASNQPQRQVRDELA